MLRVDEREGAAGRGKKLGASLQFLLGEKPRGDGKMIRMREE